MAWTKMTPGERAVWAAVYAESLRVELPPHIASTKEDWDAGDKDKPCPVTVWALSVAANAADHATEVVRKLRLLAGSHGVDVCFGPHSDVTRAVEDILER